VHIDWEIIGLAFEVACGGGSIAWWVVRGFWKNDIRFTKIEMQLEGIAVSIGGRERDRTQRHVSTGRVVKMGKAEAPDFG
jgi:hypothetical protein